MATPSPPHARWGRLHPLDDYADGIDLIDSLHPRTILAYGKNGGALPDCPDRIG